MKQSPPPPLTTAAPLAWRGAWHAESRPVPEEVPVAFTYHRETQAVMLATPADLEDFALGFSLMEGIATAPEDIAELDIVVVPEGIELRMWLRAGAEAALGARSRRLAGPTGCGLCGLDSLTDALRPPPVVTSQARFTAADIVASMQALPSAQVLNRASRAVHAAGLFVPSVGLVAAREDVGRHNALDKLAGALARAGQGAGQGILVLTSRVSVELVQKAARLGVPALAAVSVPTALAIRTAEASGIGLVGVARGEEFEVFTHKDRIAF
jgi:FdhD protein